MRKGEIFAPAPGTSCRHAPRELEIYDINTMSFTTLLPAQIAGSQAALAAL